MNSRSSQMKQPQQTTRLPFAMRSTGSSAVPRTMSQNNVPSTPMARRAPSGTAYRNNSDNVSAVLNGGSLQSPTRPRNRGVSTPATVARPSSGFNPSFTTPTTTSAVPPFSMPYEAKVVLSSGKTTNKPIQLSTGLGSLQGFRPTMEDNHISIINGTLAEGHPVSLFAILDGHCGRRVADLGAKVLPDSFFSNPNLGKNNSLALVESIVQTDRTVFNTMGKTDGGSTLIAAAIINRMCFVACLGDARAVLYEAGCTVPMSEDHKPQDPKEMQRIIRCGGSVQMGRVCGCLAVSRALGDFEFKFTGTRFIPNKELMVSNIADVKQINITDQTRFLLLACDGLWDVMTNEEATTFVVDYLRNKNVEIPLSNIPLKASVDPEGCPSASFELQRLLDECALKLADHAIEKGSMDNVSAMIVAFSTDLINDLRSDARGRSGLMSNTVVGGRTTFGNSTHGASLGGTPQRPSLNYSSYYSPQSYGRSQFSRNL